MPQDSKPKAPIVSFSNVGVKYSIGRRAFKRESFWPLEDVSLDLYHGETLGVIGRNGAGKSTLLRLIAGIIAPDRGHISNHSKSSLLLSIQVGFKHHLTGRDNVIQSGLLLGMSLEKIESAMPAIVDFAELDEHFDRPISSYSMGMRARLGFAVAVQADPEILLIDELLGVGDSRFRKKSSQYLKERIRSNETVVLVSHDNSTLESLCDRLVWIENGKSQMIGETESVLKAYNTYMDK